jgi:hypothetical protein
MVVVESAMAVAWLRKACANKPPDAKVLAMGPYQLRSLFYNFKELLSFLLAVCVSLRRSGATYFFFRHGSMEVDEHQHQQHAYIFAGCGGRSH